MRTWKEHRVGPAFWAVAVLAPVSLAWAQPQRARTLTFDSHRKEWVEQQPSRPGTAAGDLHAIRVLLKEEAYRKALSAIKAFVAQYGETDALFPNVLTAKAEALIGQGKYDAAHLALQEFLAQFAGLELTGEALRLEFIIAETYLTGVKRKVFGFRMLSGEDLALQILDEIASDHPDSPLAELAVKAKADYWFRAGEHALAELEYARLLRDYPQSRYHQFGLRRLAEAALAGFEGVDYDEAALIEARERYHDYRLRYPAAADREEVGRILHSIVEMRAEKDFATGAYYERTDHLTSAIYCFEMVRRDWPGTIAAAKATSRLKLLGALQKGPPRNVPGAPAQDDKAGEANDR